MAEISIHSLMPDTDALLALEPEELAGVVLQYLNSLPNGSASLDRYNFSLPHTVQAFPADRQDEINRALMA